MYFCYGYCLSVYLDWFPTYLNSYRGFSLKQMGYFAMMPLLAGTLGDLAGGMLSDLLAEADGRSENGAPHHRGKRVSAWRPPASFPPR